MDLQLTDKVAIVTGSSRGLGLASAIALASEGCFVCICARGAERLREAAEDVSRASNTTRRVLAVQADVATADGVALVVERTAHTFGGQ
jgi:NAD(P)-dependent dehydrogenase (short-subunit alcohol dehydrogenase family)